MNIFIFVLRFSIFSSILSDTLYEILGVDNKATTAEIKRAFRNKARSFHPDKNKDKLEWARNEFGKISNAYEVLSDPVKRDDYDKNMYSNSYFDKDWYSNFEEFFNSFEDDFKIWDDEDIELSWGDVKEVYVEVKNIVTETFISYKNKLKNWFNQH